MLFYNPVHRLLIWRLSCEIVTTMIISHAFMLVFSFSGLSFVAMGCPIIDLRLNFDPQICFKALFEISRYWALPSVTKFVQQRSLVSRRLIFDDLKKWLVKQSLILCNNLVHCLLIWLFSWSHEKPRVLLFCSQEVNHFRTELNFGLSDLL